MGARTGQQFLDKLNAMRPHITVDGEVVSDNVAEHPAFKNVASTFAQLFDLQHDPAFKDGRLPELVSVGACLREKVVRAG